MRLSRRTLLGSLALGGAAAAIPGIGEARAVHPLSGGTHGWPFFGYLGDIGAIGYVEEFFVSGFGPLAPGLVRRRNPAASARRSSLSMYDS